MSDAWHSAKISRFERVTVAPNVDLLRLAGSCAGDVLNEAPRPALIVDGGAGSGRFEPLPGPADDPGVLRAAYSVPAAALDGAPRFSLLLADGGRLELPAPVAGRGRAGDGRIATPIADGILGGGDPATEARLLTAMAEIDAQAEARIAQTHAGAEARVAEARAHAAQEIERAAAVAQALVAEAETRAAEAERREREIAAEIERRVNEGSVQARAQARAEADARAAEAAAPLRERLATAEEDARRHETAAKALSLEVESLRDARGRRERELRDALDSVRKMTFERDELSRQVEAFDQVATKARERASQAEAENERSASTLDDLQNWRGELERRMAATTSELGAARIRLREDERELNDMRAELTEAEARAQAALSELGRVRGEGSAPGVADGGAGRSPAGAGVGQGPMGDAERARLMERIGRLEAAQRDLAHRAAGVAAALAPAERLAELAQSVA
ncbi:MAG: hypothetical protein ACRDMJ_09005, partial [Solirubrobacteraceae bacterium]